MQMLGLDINWIITGIRKVIIIIGLNIITIKLFKMIKNIYWFLFKFNFVVLFFCLFPSLKPSVSRTTFVLVVGLIRRFGNSLLVTTSNATPVAVNPFKWGKAKKEKE